MKIRKQFKIEMAHRLVSAFSKDCLNWHGHSYLIEVILNGDNLNADGMVIDFGEVKAKLNNYIQGWDHCMMIAEFDPLKDRMVDMMEEFDMKYIIVPVNPTAENQSIILYQVMHEMGIPVKSVRVHETKTGWAEFDGSDDIQDMFVDIEAIVYSTATGI